MAQRKWAVEHGRSLLIHAAALGGAGARARARGRRPGVAQLFGRRMLSARHSGGARTLGLGRTDRPLVAAVVQSCGVSRPPLGHSHWADVVATATCIGVTQSRLGKKPTDFVGAQILMGPQFPHGSVDFVATSDSVARTWRELDKRPKPRLNLAQTWSISDNVAEVGRIWQ